MKYIDSEYKKASDILANKKDKLVNYFIPTEQIDNLPDQYK